jgi:hypothetical protein
LGESAGLSVGLFTVIEEFDDYLLCSGADTVTGKRYTQVAVAKPVLLQRTPFDGNGVDYGDIVVGYVFTEIGMRTASSDGLDDESQQITPDYFVDDRILAMRVGDSATGVTGADWTDLNCGGRAWAKVNDES